MYRYLLIVPLLLFLTGCSQPVEKPKPLIPEKEYINLLIELQLVRTYAESSADSLSADSLKQQVFDKYRVSSSAFKKSHQYYQKFPEQQKERINRAIELLKLDQIRKDTL